MALRLSLVVLGMAFLGSRAAGAQQITKPTIPGAINVAQLETTVACGGATKPEAVPEIKKLGFASIINLRQPTENGADVEGDVPEVGGEDEGVHRFGGCVSVRAVATIRLRAGGGCV